jgi:hypothetical protein
MPGGYWAFRTRWTSGVGGTTGISHLLSAGAGNVVDILAFRASGVIAATGALDVDLVDEDSNIVVKYADGAAAAAPSATIPRRNDDLNTTTTSLAASSWRGVRLAGPDLRLRIIPGDLAAADTLDLVLWAEVSRGIGTWSQLATGAYTAAVSVNEVY